MNEIRPQSGCAHNIREHFRGVHLSMDDLTQQASPRKKLKTQHSSLDGAMEDINEQSIEPSAATASTQSKFGAPRSDKEFKCAITEFVDLEKPGFSGILKKRSYNPQAIGNLAY